MRRGSWRNSLLLPSFLVSNVWSSVAFVPVVRLHSHARGDCPPSLLPKPRARMTPVTMTSKSSSEEKTKRIVFIRHGRTHMNDYINGIHYGGPGFTDVFPDTSESREKYYDSPLSPTGWEQVKALDFNLQRLANGDTDAATDLELSEVDSRILEDLDLIVTSPLTRALQTLEHGLGPAIRNREIPMVALPHAAERIFLVADLGKPRTILSKEYPKLDFESGFDPSLGANDFWHYQPSPEEQENYVEWRPHGEGQVYACLGEPEGYFAQRMEDLYQWLEDSPASTIAVVCHAGVILWFLGEIVENCAVRVVDVERLKSPSGLVEAPKDQAKNFK